jgi:hypothetical protein
MPTTYTTINAVSHPFPIDDVVDAQNRNIFSLNIEAEAHGPALTWEEDLVAIAQAAGVGLITSGASANVFIGTKASIPIGPGPYVTLLNTGGSGSDFTHSADQYDTLSAQFVIRATNYQAGRTMALALWRAFNGRHEVSAP